MFAGEFLSKEREGDACEVRAATETSDNNVRHFFRLFHLLQGFFADDGLVEEYVVHDTADGIVGAGVADCHLHGFRYGGSETARCVGRFMQDFPAGGSSSAGRWNDFCAPSLHHELAVGFLLIADPYHEYREFQSEMLGSETQGRAPLPSAGFGGQAADALPVVIIGLWDGSVRFVGTCHTGTFIFEINVSGRVQRFFQGVCADEGCGTPEPVKVLYFFRDVNERRGGKFLFDQFFGKDGEQILRGCRLFGFWV